MTDYMLSFTRGRPIAHALDKKHNIVQTIRLTKECELPDIEFDEPLRLLDKHDFDQVRKDLRLGKIEVDVLRKAIRKTDPEKLSDVLKRAYDILIDMANQKLKKEIHFPPGSQIEAVVPVIGEEKFDRSALFSGPSSAGKSFLIKQILLHDPKMRPVVVFSRVRHDPSFDEIDQQKLPDGKSRLIEIPIFTDEDLTNLPANSDLKNTICVFDDVHAFEPDMANYLQQYMDRLLECGRHSNTTIYSTSHVLLNYSKSRVTLNECEYCCTFPNSNRRSADEYLKSRCGLLKPMRDKLIARSGAAGRYLMMRMSHPMACIYAKGLMLLY